MDKVLHTSKHIVAFIDLLGTSEAINNDEGDINLNTVNNLITLALNMCQKNETVFIGKYDIKAFSDNIIIAHSLEKLSQEELKKVIHDLLLILSIFQYSAFEHGILVRGGITYGDLYIDDRFVWAKALIRAYKLENEFAIYPRIVIDAKVYELINYNKRNVNQDPDGINYLNYYSFIDFTYLDKCHNDHINKLIMMKNRLINNEKATQKLIWIENYIKKYYIENNNKQKRL